MAKQAEVAASYEIHSTAVESIKSHSLKQDALGGYEAVGFIACGKKSFVVTATLALNNHSPDPQHGFFVEPWEQFRAEQALDRQGYTILGVYHSHPKSEALPSQSDHQWARPKELVLIYSVVFDELNAFKERDGHLYPVELKVV